MWTDGNVEVFRDMSKKDSQIATVSIMTALTCVIAAGDIEKVVKMTRREEL